MRGIFHGKNRGKLKHIDSFEYLEIEYQGELFPTVASPCSGLVCQYIMKHTACMFVCDYNVMYTCQVYSVYSPVNIM